MAFEVDGNRVIGFFVVSTTDWLTTASLHAPEIDIQIAALKAGWDAVAKK